jgi:hypothetical protein
VTRKLSSVFVRFRAPLHYLIGKYSHHLCELEYRLQAYCVCLRNEYLEKTSTSDFNRVLYVVGS